MRILRTLLPPLFFGLFSIGQLAAQSSAPVTLVKAGRLLDPRTGNVLSPAAVLIEDGKIKEVGSPAQVQPHAPADVKTIDLGSATLLPGLIDSHTHLFIDIIVPPEPERLRHANGEFAPGLLLSIVESPTKRALVGAQLAREDGVTPSVETNSYWHTRRLMIFPTQTASFSPEWSSAGEAEAGSAEEQPAKE